MSNQKSTNKHPQYKYASTREKYCFGIGAIGKDAICNLVGSFLMLYFTDTLYLAPAFVGVLFLVARIWDAINDPVMGMICDNTHTKFGKFRIWLVIGTLLSFIRHFIIYLCIGNVYTLWNDIYNHGCTILVMASKLNK